MKDRVRTNLVLGGAIVAVLVAAWALVGCGWGTSVSPPAQAASSGACQAASPASNGPGLTVVAEAKGHDQIGIGVRPPAQVAASATTIVKVLDENGTLVSTQTGKLDDFGFA